MRTATCFLLPVMMSLVLTGPAFAQESNTAKNKIFVTGAVYDSETREPLSNTQFSIHRNEVHTTYPKGRFSLFGQPGDTISYRYTGYKEIKIVIPDTLRQLEYLMGVFMPKDTILMPEVVIFPRAESYPTILTDVKDNEEMINQAQKNVNDATKQGLTRNVGTNDADMSAKSALRAYEMKAQYKGLLVTPENSVGVSNFSYHTHYLQFGSRMVRPGKMENRAASQHEIKMLLTIHEIMKVDSARLPSRK